MKTLVMLMSVASMGWSSPVWAQAQPANATYQWRAQKTRIAGMVQACGLGYPDFRIEIKNGVIHGEPLSEGDSPLFNRPFTIKLKAPKPDGSGQVVLNNNPKRQNVIYTVEAGVGPRAITLRREDTECTYQFIPYP